MNITTEKAERLAKTCDVVEAPPDIATALRSLAAERDALRAKVERPESGVSYETFVSAMQIVTIERDALKAENEKLRAALRFYAGDEPWKWTSEDYGEVARVALGEKE